MRKKYTKWYMDHEETVERSLLLRIIHYWLFSPSVYCYEVGIQWSKKYDDCLK